MINLGAADIDARLEEQLIDGILYAFQEQTNEVSSYLPLPIFYLSVLSICLFICLLIYLSIYLSIYLALYSFIS